MAVIPGNQAPDLRFGIRKSVPNSPSISPEIEGRLNTSVQAGKLGGEPVLSWDRGADPRKVGRLLSSAQQVARLTNEGGSSSDLYSLDVIPAGERKFMVGGTPDPRTKEAFPTQLVDVGAKDPKLTVHDVLATRQAMLPAALAGRGGSGYQQPVYGTWKGDGYDRVDVDLSTGFDSERKAEDMTMSRKEYAMFDNAAMEEVSNEQIRRKRGLPVSPKDTEKDDKQEVVYRRHGG